LDLTEAAEDAGFDVLVTTDKNIRYQQNLERRKIAIVVLGHSQWPIVKLVAVAIAVTVDAALPGSYIESSSPLQGITNTSIAARWKNRSPQPDLLDHKF
jgi:hypothetical protein